MDSLWVPKDAWNLLTLHINIYIYEKLGRNHPWLNDYVNVWRGFETTKSSLCEDIHHMCFSGGYVLQGLGQFLGNFVASIGGEAWEFDSCDICHPPELPPEICYLLLFTKRKTVSQLPFFGAVLVLGSVINLRWDFMICFFSRQNKDWNPKCIRFCCCRFMFEEYNHGLIPIVTYWNILLW